MQDNIEAAVCDEREKIIEICTGRLQATGKYSNKPGV